jgi:hypothetical protein
VPLSLAQHAGAGARERKVVSWVHLAWPKPCAAYSITAGLLCTSRVVTGSVIREGLLFPAAFCALADLLRFRAFFFTAACQNGHELQCLLTDVAFDLGSSSLHAIVWPRASATP